MARKSKTKRKLDEIEKELDDPELSEEFRQAAKELIEELRLMDEENDNLSRILYGHRERKKMGYDEDEYEDGSNDEIEPLLETRDKLDNASCYCG